MKNAYIILMLTLFLALGCSSDREAPVGAEFVGGDGYNVEAGSTSRYLETPECSTITVPLGIGESSLLRMGEYNGVSFDAILLKFDFDSLQVHYGKTATGVLLDLPVQIVQDTLYSMDVTFHQLQAPFTEDDTLTTVPSYHPDPIPDPYGGEVRTLDPDAGSFAIDESIVQEWLDDEISDPWSNGLAVVEHSSPERPGLIELYSSNFGTNPPRLRLRFSDGSADTFGVEEDYTVTSFDYSGGLHCVGGVATRVFINFSLDGLNDRALIHSANLVFTVDRSSGFGITPGESRLLQVDSTYYYYLYAPHTDDPSAGDEFLSGTSVATGSISPNLKETFRIPVSGLVASVDYGYRKNNGLVLQSDLETVRLQRLSLFTGEAADSLYRPWLEVFYSMPADFSKDK